MKSFRTFIVPFLVGGGLCLLVGCSSGPSADDVAHLDALKQEVASLQKVVDQKKTEKANLDQLISTKKQELAKVTQDENETKANLANYKQP